MTLKENLCLKIKIDRLLGKILSTLVEIPGRRKLDLNLTRELLDGTDFGHKEVRDLKLYVRPFDGDISEILVLNNELPIYHTTSENAALCMGPLREEAFGTGNIKKYWSIRMWAQARGRNRLNGYAPFRCFAWNSFALTTTWRN